MNRGDSVDGGPAFPVAPPNNNSGYGAGGGFPVDRGMTLRDWFAGQAIGHILATAVGPNVDQEIMARGAYLVADAMLAERLKVKP